MKGNMTLTTGTVIWFNDAKGFGYLKAEDGTEAFVHFSNIVGSLKRRRTLLQDQRVEFELAQGEKGPYAVNVKVIT